MMTGTEFGDTLAQIFAANADIMAVMAEDDRIAFCRDVEGMVHRAYDQGMRGPVLITYVNAMLGAVP